jgi:hypothetical protein
MVHRTVGNVTGSRNIGCSFVAACYLLTMIYYSDRYSSALHSISFASMAQRIETRKSQTSLVDTFVGGGEKRPITGNTSRFMPHAIV